MATKRDSAAAELASSPSYFPREANPLARARWRRTLERREIREYYWMVSVTRRLDNISLLSIDNVLVLSSPRLQNGCLEGTTVRERQLPRLSEGHLIKMRYILNLLIET